jgi:hypothetical protein
MSITCEALRERLGLLADGSLDPAEEKPLREHLEACEACRCEEELMRRTLEALGSLGAVPVPKEFRQDLRDRLHEEAVLLPARRAFRRNLALAASVALCAGLALGLGLGRGFGSGPPAQPRIAQTDGGAPAQPVLPVAAYPDDSPPPVPPNWRRVAPDRLPRMDARRAGGSYYYLGGSEQQGAARDYFLEPEQAKHREKQRNELPAVIHVSF